MKRISRIAIVLTLACLAFSAFSNFAQAQKIDIGFGVGTTLAPSANSNGPSLTGGAFPGVSGDFLFYHSLGFGAEVFWRGGQRDNYPGFSCPGCGYRPVFYDFNAVYSPKIVNHVYLELVGGLGALSTHYYACSSCSGNNYIGSSTHFNVDVGGGIKIYPKGGFFIRPEFRYYFVNNNTDYSSDHASRVGASIGYTFR